jgi:hypothetical protein
VRLNQFQLKRDGRLRGAGKAVAALSAAFALFGAHCAFIRWHEVHGTRDFAAAVAGPFQLGAGETADFLERAIGHMETVRRFGLYDSPRLLRRLAAARRHRGVLLSVLGREAEAQVELREAERLNRRP